MSHTRPKQAEQEILLAEKLWPGQIRNLQQIQLRALVEEYGFSISSGDVQLLYSRWYVTHAGLLHLAKKGRCSGIQTEVLPQFCDPGLGRWVIKATVFKSHNSKGFVGYGDADPSNVSDLVRGAEMRVAETRAVNRALRKAYGIGLCSVEEIGTCTEGVLPGRNGGGNNNNNNDDPQPSRLRDRLLLLIRQHDLDPAQVKRFAEAFCGNKPLREANRQQVEEFLEHLTHLLSQDREHALEELAHYAIAPGVTDNKKDNREDKATEAA